MMYVPNERSDPNPTSRITGDALCMAFENSENCEPMFASSKEVKK
jgi:hypothetical protein